MLRQQHFLPSQLRAAYEIVNNRLADGILTDSQILTEWFGKSREFLPSHSGGKTPLVNNITAAAVYADQHGRLYAYADPSDYEYPPEPLAVPDILFTDRLFVAISNEQRHAANEEERSVPLEGTQLPQIDEVLQLHRLDQLTAPAMSVSVFAFIEPTGDQPRRSSGFIQIEGLLHTRQSVRAQTAQACLEALLFYATPT